MIQDLRWRIADGDLTHGEEGSAPPTIPHIERVVSDVRLARPMKVVMDCGNGVAGAVAPALFRQVGCELVELYRDVDGYFEPPPIRQA